MNYLKSLLASLFFGLCAISSGAQTAVSDTLDLKILFDRSTRESEPQVRDSVLHIDEFLSLLKSYNTESVNVHIKLESGAPSSAYVLRDSVPQPVSDTVYVTEVVTRKKREWKDYKSQTPMFAVRTNALAVPLLNVGVEVPIGKNWSVGADYYYPWIWRGNNVKTCNQFMAFDLEGRYWFSSDKLPEESRLLGHSVGAYVAAGYYDFERNWEGHQGEYVNVGVDYLYAMPLLNGLIHMEFELGFGYIYSRAVPYRFIGQECYLDKNVQRHVHWIGPTKAQVSVVMPLTKDQLREFGGIVGDAFSDMSDWFSALFKSKK